MRIPAFCDMHVHARQGDVLNVVNESLAYSQHVLLMPNTNPPLTRKAQVVEYLEEVEKVRINKDISYVHCAMYITENTEWATVYDARESGIFAGKIYPQAATTGSDHGVRNYKNLHESLSAMQEKDIVCCLHGEVPWVAKPKDVFDWEREFVQTIFPWITETFPKLRVVLEHITTQWAVRAVSEARAGVAATITPHHLLITRDDILAHGIKPLNYCKPVAKGYDDQEALLQAAVSGSGKFMLGSDSAPHPMGAKFSACGCAGCFTAPVVPAAVAQVFDDYYGSLDGPNCSVAVEALTRFTSANAMKFYCLEYTGRHITLEKDSGVRYPKTLRYGGEDFPVWGADRDWKWSLTEVK